MPGDDDVLDKLTIAHTDMMKRHGRLSGSVDIEPPADAKTFAAEQAAKGVAIDEAITPAVKAVALLGKESHRHEQTGRLAIYLAAYEATFGDRDDAASMRELGRDHLGIAADLRERAEAEAAYLPSVTNPQRGSGLLADFVTSAMRATTPVEPSIPNGRQRSDREPLP